MCFIFFILHFVFVSFVDFSYFACLLSFAIEKIFALCVWKRVFWAVQAVKSILNWDNSKSKSNNSSNNWQATKATTTIQQQHLNNAHVVVAGRFNFFLPFFLQLFLSFLLSNCSRYLFCLHVCVYVYLRDKTRTFLFVLHLPALRPVRALFAPVLLPRSSLCHCLCPSLSSSLTLPQISRSRSRIRSACFPWSASLLSPTVCCYLPLAYTFFSAMQFSFRIYGQIK